MLAVWGHWSSKKTTDRDIRTPTRSRGNKGKEKMRPLMLSPSSPCFKLHVLAKRINNSLTVKGWTRDKLHLVTLDAGASMEIARPDIIA
jgi:hypothetical protein